MYLGSELSARLRLQLSVQLGAVECAFKSAVECADGCS